MVPTRSTHKDPPAGELVADGRAGQTRLEPVGRPGNAWMLFAGGLIGFALVKEVFGRVWRHPAIFRARHASRDEEAFSVALLLGLLQRVGARVLGSARPS